MNILLTGATGLLGKRIIKKLNNEHVVAGLTTSQQGVELLETLHTKAYLGDIRNQAFVLEMVQDFQPDLIIHQVTSLKQLNSADNAAIREVGTKNLVEAALACQVPKIISQSISWAYEPGTTPATEETTLDLLAQAPRQTTIHGIAQLEAQTKRLENHVILRYGALYGPETWYDHTGYIYQQFMDNQATVSQGVTNFIHVDDAVDACLAAITLPTGTYNIVDDEPASGPTWAPYYAAQVGVEVTPTYVPGATFERAVSNEKYKKHGGQLSYPSWREGMKQTDSIH